MEILEKPLFGNEIGTWALGLLAFAFTWIALGVLKRLIIKRLERLTQRTSSRADDLIAQTLRTTKRFFLFAVALFVGSFFLKLPAEINQVLKQVVIIALLFQAGIWGSEALTLWFDQYSRSKTAQQDNAAATTVGLMSFVSKLALYTLLVLVALNNLGVNITALVAGLGVGGIAIALAVQNILGDLLASLTIVLDKPFIAGDFIIVDDFLGTIERVGLKTTRVRSLSGEQVIFPNSNLLQSRIRNYKRMNERRVVFTIRVVHQTALEKLEKIPGILRQAIEAQKLTRFDRSHFSSVGPSSLDFESVFYVNSPDYAEYMNAQQAINLYLLKNFRENGIELAYPTQSVFVSQSAHSTFEAVPSPRLTES